MRTRCVVVLSLVLGLLAAPARAQEKNVFAIGVNYSTKLATDGDTTGTHGAGFTWRLGHGNAGWGWSYGLGWFDTHLTHTIGGQRVPLGEVKVRPIVGGYGYTHQLSDRWFLTGDLVGGFAFTRFTLGDDVAAPSALQSVDAHMGAITPIVRPEVKTWYDINRRFGVTVGAWYAIARPKLTLDTPFGREAFRVNADTFSITTGVVYRVF